VLLEQIGVRCAVVATELEEVVLPGEAPEDYVRRVALDKACAGRALVAARSQVPVLGADTAVVIGGRILGKPADEREATEMMRQLSGRTHRVLTAVTLLGAERRQAMSISEVRFRAVTRREACAYWRTGEPLDKAGGYAIQGLGAVFIAALRGSYSGVVGLPLCETAQLLAAEGIEVLAGEYEVE
jgi:septum formation protein